MTLLAVGKKAPLFTLQGSDGKKHSLKDYAGKKVVLYFYPKDNTSGCTKEACSFRDNITEIRKKGAVVIGISADSFEAHQKFVKKYNLNFPLLSDTEKKNSAYLRSLEGEKYVWKEIYGDRTDNICY